LIQKWRDVQNEPIWANFWEKAKGIVLVPFFKHRYIFLTLTVVFLGHIIKITHLFD
jgi:hypothetical protein